MTLAKAETPIATVTALAYFSRLDGFAILCEQAGAALIRRLGMFIAVDLLTARVAFALADEREARRKATRRWPRAHWRSVKHDAGMSQYTARARELARARSGGASA